MTFRPRVPLANLIRAPALSFRDMRLLAISGAFDSIGMIGESLILGWVTLLLTDSPFMVAAALGARMAPGFFLGAVAGAVTDVVDRRVMMITLNVPLACIAVGIGLLIHLDYLQVWHLFVLPVAAGCMSTLNMTLRQTFVADIVGAGNLLNGLAFLNVGMRSGGLIGALGVGFILERLGPDVAYFVMAASYVTTISILLMMSRGPRSQGERPQLHVLRNLNALGAELRRNNMLLTLVVMTAVLELFGFSNFALYPSLAKDELGVGAQGFGVMNACRSLGGVMAVVVVAVTGAHQRRGLIYLLVVLVFGGAVLLLGFSTNFLLAIAVIALISGMAALSDIYSQSIMQSVVPSELRGRAMGAWVVAAGVGPLGNLQIGALASTGTIAFALGANGVALIALGVLGLAFLPKLRRL